MGNLHSTIWGTVQNGEMPRKAGGEITDRKREMGKGPVNWSVRLRVKNEKWQNAP